MRGDTGVVVGGILARLQWELRLAVRIHEHDTAICVVVLVIVRGGVAVVLVIGQALCVTGGEGRCAVVTCAGGLLASNSENTA